MAEYLSWTRLLESGGPTVLILVICSIVSFIVILERAVYFRGRTRDIRGLVDQLTRGAETLTPKSIRELLVGGTSPVHYVLNECMNSQKSTSKGTVLDAEVFEEVKSRAIAEKLIDLERYLNIEATLGTVSPFIGLFGTVLGIIRAFQSLGQSGGAGAGAAGAAVQNSAAGLSGLNAGIAEALIATAAGLFVAIPATIAYNYFRKQVNGIILQMEVAASRLKVILLNR